MTPIAILGATASGKSDLALKLAQKTNSNILSLDSLSIYKDIDIVSAKPSKKELLQIKHYGINEIYPNEHFNVKLFENIYHNAYKESIRDNKGLIIVGGTGFYLKALIDGLSTECIIDNNTMNKTDELMKDVENAYKILKSIDKEYASKITYNDTYRIQKALNIYYQSNLSISEWFDKNPRVPIIKNINIYNINIDKEILNHKIKLRTKSMIDKGLIDEVQMLINKYGIDNNCMKSIGIKESILFINDEIKSEQALVDLISSNTRKLAKRQRTFNKTQFKNIKNLSIENIYRAIWYNYKNS